jgi:hypothetical protein
MTDRDEITRGAFHNAEFKPGIVANGSITGYNEYRKGPLSPNEGPFVMPVGYFKDDEMRARLPLEEQARIKKARHAAHFDTGALKVHGVYAGEGVHGDSPYRISPRFPTVGEAHERILRQREKYLARFCMVMAPLSLAAAIFIPSSRPEATYSFVASVFAFIVVCFTSGNRQWRRSQS